jgi:DNA-binding MarR family transcriptional regulator
MNGSRAERARPKTETVRRDNAERRLRRDCRLGQRGRAEGDSGLGRDIARDTAENWPDVVFVETEFTRLWARWESAVEELGGAVPANQLRALLIIDDSGVLPTSQLAAALGTSQSVASRLCDRMAAAGLLRCELAAGTRPGITLAATVAGQRLAGWIRGRRRAVLARDLGSMSADGRRALARGLSELAVRQVRPRRDGMPPQAHR